MIFLPFPGRVRLTSDPRGSFFRGSGDYVFTGVYGRYVRARGDLYFRHEAMTKQSLKDIRKSFKGAPVIYAGRGQVGHIETACAGDRSVCGDMVVDRIGELSVARSVEPQMYDVVAWLACDVYRFSGRQGTIHGVSFTDRVLSKYVACLEILPQGDREQGEGMVLDQDIAWRLGR